MNTIIKFSLGVCLGLSPVINYSVAQTNTNVGNLSGTGGTGTNNSFYGYAAGQNTSSGSHNTFLGSQSGTQNLDGAKNVFVGWYSGHSNVSGYNNLFMGTKTGKSNTSGYRNTFVGPGAGLSNITGFHNTSLGYLAGKLNQYGNYNVFLGSLTGHSNQGSYNVFIGNQAGYYEVGSNKLYIDNSSTQSPLIYGDFAQDQLKVNGELEVTGDLNSSNVNATSITGTYVNGSSLNLNSSAGMGLSISEEMVTPCVTTKWHFIMGRTCGVGPFPPPSKEMTFHYGGGGANIGISNDSPSYKFDVNGIVRASNFITLSDRQLKQDVKTIENAGELIRQLEGVTYTFKEKVRNEGRNLPAGRQIGFIAQDVQKVLPEVVEEDEQGLLGVTYQSLIPLLVEHQKELQTQNDQLVEEIEEVKEANEQLAAEMAEIKALLKKIAKDGSVKMVELENTNTKEILRQNAPNPFSESTTIEYDLPENCAGANLLIQDSSGKLIKSVENLKTGVGRIEVQAHALTPGMYRYTIVCQGKTLATKSMIIVE